MLLGEGSVESMPVFRRRRREGGGGEGWLKNPSDGGVVMVVVVVGVWVEGDEGGGWERKRESWDSWLVLVSREVDVGFGKGGSLGRRKGARRTL